ncbi:MAG: HPr family phosphocarrier protein [Gammaproteobacteria bacterium]|nr:MAG: HPr family phosphocarrier protein [Gammaproteobacteria bacterium]UCH39884.1 MAG: HPr family phosphocarrier protein [Gammaproteobacteria bacterium]
MISETITIINKLGLHARAASKLVNCASQFESDVFISRKQNRINAKSIMGVMMLAASKGVELQLEIEGNDEQACRDALVSLINDRFGESE